MKIRQQKSLFLVAAMAVLGSAAAFGQTQDTSGNSTLKGTYAFRQVAIQNVDSNYNPSEVTATYGTITFDGAGNYAVIGTQVDNTYLSGAPQPYSINGTYAIGSNGAGYIASILYPGDPNDNDYGAVSQGVFTGSSTEAFNDGYILNDIFIAIPISSTAPSNSSFTTSYQTGLIDFASGGSAAIKNALFELNPNGSGAFGTINLTGQASNQFASTLTQSITGATYNFQSGGSATLTIPLPASTTATNALFTGSKTIYQSADGNFILGWTSTGYDIFFGVKALAAGSGNNSITKGLYFTSAVEDAPSGYGVDSYYGGISNSGDSAGDGVVHQRLNYPLEYSFDYGSDDQITLNSDGSSTIDDYDGYSFLFGDGGQAFVAIGTYENGYFSLVVGLHAATFTGTGVYLNPVGVVNAASYQPITASLAPGELITLYGSGLASSTVATQGGQAFPTTLSGVSATINSIPCPIYYVSPTSMSVIVPYEISSNTTGLANIQVNNNGALSNVVQMYFADSAPGAFSANQNGIGYALALHALTGQLITQANPAQPNEYISLYLTGLGLVSPSITDGALGPSSTLSVSELYTANNLSVYFNDYTAESTGNAGTIEFAGLAPGLAGLYQINVQVPSGVLGSGDNVYVEFVTDEADVNQIQIPYGSSTAQVAIAKTRRMRPIPTMRTAGKKVAHHNLRGGVPGAQCAGHAGTRGCIQ